MARTHTRAQERAPEHTPALGASARAHIAALGDMADKRERARIIAEALAPEYTREMRLARACRPGTRAMMQHYGRAQYLCAVERLANKWGASVRGAR